MEKRREFLKNLGDKILENYQNDDSLLACLDAVGRSDVFNNIKSYRDQGNTFPYHLAYVFMPPSATLIRKDKIIDHHIYFASNHDINYTQYEIIYENATYHCLFFTDTFDSTPDDIYEYLNEGIVETDKSELIKRVKRQAETNWHHIIQYPFMIIISRSWNILANTLDPESNFPTQYEDEMDILLGEPSDAIKKLIELNQPKQLREIIISMGHTDNGPNPLPIEKSKIIGSAISSINKKDREKVSVTRYGMTMSVSLYTPDEFRLIEFIIKQLR